MAAAVRALLRPAASCRRLRVPVPVLLAARGCSSAGPPFQFLQVQKAGSKGSVGLIRLQRPQALNALCEGLMAELRRALDAFEADAQVGAIVITGSDKAFAGSTAAARLPALPASGKPTIAAVNGYAVSVPVSLRALCRVPHARGRDSWRSPPAVPITPSPGAGGTQRLTRAVGKSLAMEMVLTGERISAAEAKAAGLVSKVFPVDKLLDAAISCAEKIASNSKLVVAMAKESVNAAFETTLAEGNRTEKRLFYATFATDDRKEGMTAFVEKRKANFTDS
uniref:Enoyl-CoA hydratase, mitochondrial n=1 Tax=Anas platyrhynchos TaxID=8839 RepID=A0A8B9SJK7_ANAPL